MADPQPVDAPLGVDPSIVSAMQGGFGAPAMDPRAYGGAPPTAMDASMLPAPVAQAVQSGFAPPPGVVDGLGAPGAPQYAPPPFQPAPLADPFPPSPMAAPEVAGAMAGAAPSKADIVAAKQSVADQAAAHAADIKTQAAQAKEAAKQAAYDATPQGMDEAATRQQLEVNKQQQADALAKGEIDAKQAAEVAPILDRGVADEQEILRKQQAAREADFAQLKQMVVHNGKAVEEAAKRTVDPNRMWNNMSTAQHIGVGIMTILAGVGQGLARDNGPNPVGKMISEAIDRDVDSQKGSIEQGNKAIEQRRQLAQDFGQLSDKQSDQYEYMRAKGRMVVADQLEAAAAHYGSPKAMMAAKIEADAKRMEAAKIVQGLSERKQAQLNKDAELSTARASVGVAGYAAQTGRLELNEKVKEFGVATADKELARQEGHQFKMEEQAAAAAAKAAAKGKASEGEIMFPSGQLNPDGSPHHMKLMNEPTSPTADNPTGENPYSLKTVGGPAEQAKVMEKFNASTQLIKDLDDLRELYDKNPGSLNKWNSDARLKAQSLTRAVIHAHQAYGIAGFKGPVVEMMDKTILGTDDEHDVNSVLKDLAPQLNSVRDHTLDERVAMLGPNFTGKRQQLDIPDPLKNKPPESAWSKELTKLQAKAPEIPVGGGVQGKTAELMRKAQGAGSMMNGLSEDQQQFLRIAAKSINEPTTRAQTTQKLDDIVSKPEMPATFRAAAQHLLDTLNRPKVTQIED